MWSYVIKFFYLIFEIVFSFMKTLVNSLAFARKVEWPIKIWFYVTFVMYAGVS